MLKNNCFINFNFLKFYYYYFFCYYQLLYQLRIQVTLNKQIFLQFFVLIKLHLYFLDLISTQKQILQIKQNIIFIYLLFYNYASIRQLCYNLLHIIKTKQHHKKNLYQFSLKSNKNYKFFFYLIQFFIFFQKNHLLINKLLQILQYYFYYLIFFFFFFNFYKTLLIFDKFFLIFNCSFKKKIYKNFFFVFFQLFYLKKKIFFFKNFLLIQPQKKNEILPIPSTTYNIQNKISFYKFSFHRKIVKQYLNFSEKSLNFFYLSSLLKYYFEQKNFLLTLKYLYQNFFNYLNNLCSYIEDILYALQKYRQIHRLIFKFFFEMCFKEYYTILTPIFFLKKNYLSVKMLYFSQIFLKFRFYIFRLLLKKILQANLTKFYILSNPIKIVQLSEKLTKFKENKISTDLYNDFAGEFEDIFFVKGFESEEDELDNFFDPNPFIPQEHMVLIALRNYFTDLVISKSLQNFVLLFLQNDIILKKYAIHNSTEFSIEIPQFLNVIQNQIPNLYNQRIVDFLPLSLHAELYSLMFQIIFASNAVDYFLLFSYKFFLLHLFPFLNRFLIKYRWEYIYSVNRPIRLFFKRLSDWQNDFIPICECLAYDYLNYLLDIDIDYYLTLNHQLYLNLWILTKQQVEINHFFELWIKQY